MARRSAHCTEVVRGFRSDNSRGPAPSSGEVRAVPAPAAPPASIELSRAAIAREGGRTGRVGPWSVPRARLPTEGEEPELGRRGWRHFPGTSSRSRLTPPCRPGWLPGGCSARYCSGAVTGAARPVRPRFMRSSARSAGRQGERCSCWRVTLSSCRSPSPGLRPVIVLPAALCDGGDSRELRFCLAHEWSHIERRDARAWNFAAVAGFVLFYQPLFWWLRRQLRLCQDYLADDRAAALASAEDYAAYLVRLARARRTGFGLAGAGGQRPALEPLPEGSHARPGP